MLELDLVLHQIRTTNPDLMLPLPPSDNRRLQPMRGRLILTTEATEYQAEIKRILGGMRVRTITVNRPLYLLYKVYLPSKRQDPSNFTKVLKDALEGCIYDNDQFVMPWAVDVEFDRKEPRIEIWFVRSNRESL